MYARVIDRAKTDESWLMTLTSDAQGRELTLVKLDVTRRKEREDE
jgi:hypothetical protein